MSLNWSIKRCEHPPILQTPEWWPITNAMIWASMAIGIGDWTEERLPEIVLRLRITGCDQFTRTGEDGEEEPFTLTPAEIRKYIGLNTNVAYETRAKWTKRWYEGRLHDTVRELKQETARAGQ